MSESSLKDLNSLNAFKEVTPQEKFFLPFGKGQNLLCVQIYFHFFEIIILTYLFSNNYACDIVDVLLYLHNLSVVTLSVYPKPSKEN